jgi:hypothetical protein
VKPLTRESTAQLARDLSATVKTYGHFIDGKLCAGCRWPETQLRVSGGTDLDQPPDAAGLTTYFGHLRLALFILPQTPMSFRRTLSLK